MVKRKCKHCGTSFLSGQGAGEFCCDGCQHVHNLICSEGLDTYYQLQDRIGRPVGALSEPQIEALRHLQSQAEQGAQIATVSLRVTGMSCLGCVWLVERVVRSQPGCIRVQASLQSNTLSIRWRPDRFDLCELGDRLSGFGYQLSELSAEIRGWSPLAWRSLVCAVLALNSLLLTGILLALGESASAKGLIELLLLAVVGICLLVGLPQFLLPVLRSARMRSLHHDCLSCLGVLLLVPLQFASTRASTAWVLPVVLALLLVVRVIHVRCWQVLLLERFDLQLNFSERGMRIAQRVLILNALALVPLLIAAWLRGAELSLLLGWQFAASACLAFSLYPLAIASRYGMALWWQLLGLAVGWCGAVLVMLGLMGILSAVLWMLCSGLLWILAFVVWQQLSDPAK